MCSDRWLRPHPPWSACRARRLTRKRAQGEDAAPPPPEAGTRQDGSAPGVILFESGFRGRVMHQLASLVRGVALASPSSGHFQGRIHSPSLINNYTSLYISCI